MSRRWAFYLPPVMKLKTTLLLFILIVSYYRCTAADAVPRICVSRVTNLSTGSKSIIPDLKREDYIELDVSNLNLWMRKRPKDADVILYINKIPFRDLKPVFIDTCDNFVIFKFKKDTTEEKSWAFFYKRPRKDVISNAQITIGWNTDCGIESDAYVNLVIIIKGYKTWGLISIAAFLVWFGWLAWKKAILRDSSNIEDVRKRPFSLARTQFSFWTILIACSYVFLWISTGETPVLSNASLILLGISGGTSILAKLIENNQQTVNLNEDKVSKGFFVDIMSDEKGISVHRFQMLVFTIVSGVIFIHDVKAIFEMPELNDTLLLLMGISNGTYAGFKVTENNKNATVG
jgi:hypothetical protein